MRTAPPTMGSMTRLTRLFAAIAALSGLLLSAAAPPPPTWSPVRTSPVVLRPFDPPVQPWLPGHRGVDLAAGNGLLLAPASGTITFSQWVVHRPVVVFTHHDGLRSALEPAHALHPVGTTLRRGDVMAQWAPETPHCAEPCVHWSVRRADTYLDPMRLGRRPIRLVPIP